MSFMRTSAGLGSYNGFGRMMCGKCVIEPELAIEGGSGKRNEYEVLFLISDSGGFL